ncbi:hypothetical protein ABZ916_39700 [Streptomyces sp. NPDC046853]|uniref:hypothetical protein n=1 Tax=Streptomyces sp. NPDC046853 TaxID=3154920 RepID=UPI0033D41DBA
MGHVMEQGEQGAEQSPAPHNPTIAVPADGLTVDEPFEAPADVATQWDFRIWGRP